MKQIRQNLINFILKKYNVVGDCPWAKYPEFKVFRHPDNKKWFGLIMTVSREKIGLIGQGNIDVLNIKTDSVVIGGFIKQSGILPAYHMNKSNWATILLDGTVPIKDIEFLLNVSFELTKNRKNVLLR